MATLFVTFCFFILLCWELTRLSFHPIVLSLIGQSGTDWNLMKLVKLIWLLWDINGEHFLERHKFTGANQDCYLCAPKTPFWCLSLIKAQRLFFFLLLFYRDLFSVRPCVGWECHGNWELLCSSTFLCLPALCFSVITSHVIEAVCSPTVSFCSSACFI